MTTEAAESPDGLTSQTFPQLKRHLPLVVDQIANGQLIPFLGAGVNLTSRTEPFQKGRTLPSGTELAQYLARKVGYGDHEQLDLVRAAQYVALLLGENDLYLDLRSIFNIHVEFNETHRFLAELPGLLRERGQPYPTSLIVTTNYDDLLESAFRRAGEPFDVVRYIAEGKDSGKFMHVRNDGSENIILQPNNYPELDPDQQTVILKIHGAVDRTDREDDSYVITEDHYIDYLSREDISNLIPSALMAELRRSHLLFLGYSLSDWNLRVILRRIWREQRLGIQSWAVQLRPSEIEQKLWSKRDVDILDVPIDRYIGALRELIEALPSAMAGVA